MIMNTNRQITRNPSRRVKRRITVAAAAVFVLYVLGSFGKLHYLNYAERRDLAAVRARQVELHREIESLKKEKKNLENIDYLKDYARRKLFLMGEGEIPIRITNAPWEAKPEEGGGKSGSK